MYQQCPSGCSGVVCNATSTGSSSLTAPFTTDTTDTNTNTNSNGTSSIDLIDYFANPPSDTTAVGTATPIDISQQIQDIGNASTLGGSAPAGSQPGQQQGQIPAGAYGPSPAQTFTSNDLANSPGYNEPSTFQLALTNMKATLVAILGYLQPFGGAVSARQNAYLE